MEHRVLHDIFLTRYPQPLLIGSDLPPDLDRCRVQIFHIIFKDLAPALNLDSEFFRAVHDALARELGVGQLARGRNATEMCVRFLGDPYDLWNDAHGSADTYLKSRLSMVELLLRSIEAKRSPQPQSAPASMLHKLIWWRGNSSAQQIANINNETYIVDKAITELNARLRSARLPLHYHNGFLQFAQDELVETKLADPCWRLLGCDTKWANADRELKEAFDAADNRRSDAAFHAAKALESVIKVISDEKGWTRGTESGAVAYIDNLVSQQNGRFIVPWEAELLKAFFKHVRNPHGHGAGSQRPPSFNEYQTAWSLETAMSWIKSLILRY